MNENSSTTEFTLDHIEKAIRYLQLMSFDEYGPNRQEIAKAVEKLRTVLTTKSQTYYHSPEYIKAQRERHNKAVHKKKLKESLEARVVEWAEANLQEGDFVQFLGTRGNPWRLVVSIERTKFPEYYASRVHGNAIQWKHTTIKYAAYTFTGTSSWNGMEKIALVVRNGVEVFNRKSVHLKK